MRTWFIAGPAGGVALDLVTAAAALSDRIAVATDEQGWRDVLGDHRGQVHVGAGFRGNPAATVQAMISALGPIDVAVVIADHEVPTLAAEASDTQVHEVFRANWTEPLRLIQALLPVMRSQRGGHVIFLSATGKGWADGLYEASRAALRATTEALHRESEPYGVAVSFLEYARPELAQGGAGTPDGGGDQSIGAPVSSDGAAIAAAVLEVAGAVEPPTFLPLGSTAIRGVETRAARHAEELAVWRDVAELRPGDDARQRECSTAL